AVFFEQLTQMVDVAVSIQPRDGLLGDRPAEPHAVDDARVVELIAVDHILIVALPQIVRNQPGKESLVRTETRRMHYRRFATHDLRYAPFEFEVNRFGP